MSPEYLNKLYNSIVVTRLFDRNLPFDQRERFEKVMLHFEPEFYENVYLPFLNGDAGPLIATAFQLRKEAEKRAMSIFDEPDRDLLIAQKIKKI